MGRVIALFIAASQYTLQHGSNSLADCKIYTQTSLKMTKATELTDGNSGQNDVAHGSHGPIIIILT